MTITEWDFDVELKVARKEERMDEKIRAARKLIVMGKSVNEIVDVTDLDLNTVLHLQDEG